MCSIDGPKSSSNNKAVIMSRIGKSLASLSFAAAGVLGMGVTESGAVQARCNSGTAIQSTHDSSSYVETPESGTCNGNTVYSFALTKKSVGCVTAWHRWINSSSTWQGYTVCYSGGPKTGNFSFNDNNTSTDVYWSHSNGGNSSVYSNSGF